MPKSTEEMSLREKLDVAKAAYRDRLTVLVKGLLAGTVTRQEAAERLTDILAGLDLMIDQVVQIDELRGRLIESLAGAVEAERGAKLEAVDQCKEALGIAKQANDVARLIQEHGGKNPPSN